jgi:hypothetical protein
MLTLSSIVWTSLAIALISFWWQGDMIKRIALQHLHQYFREQDLQLLDQTIVLKGVWPRRSDSGSLQLRRRYEFEFTSTGEARYQGLIELNGRRVHRIELEPHLLPDTHDHLQ